MQLAKDSQILAEGQDKLTNLRTPGMMKEGLSERGQNQWRKDFEGEEAAFGFKVVGCLV